VSRIFRRAALAAGAATAVAAGTAVLAVPAHAAGNYSAFVFSNGSTQPQIYSFINSATSTLDMTMYELEDTTAVNDLIARENAGVTVRVVLDGAHTSENASAYSKLKAAGVGVVYSSTTNYVYTHQKTITVDGDESLILTGNLTSQYYSTGRDYGVFDSNQVDVNAIEKAFAKDYALTAFTATDGDNLLWSPNTSQTRLLSIINGATTTLDVEELEFSDTAVVNAIAARAKAGVTVRIVVETPSDYSAELATVKAAGATVRGYSSSTGTYIHAKVIVADYGLSGGKTEVGSMNISSNSLGNNRELGIITTDTGVASTVETQFAGDYANGTAY
jgi:phosphatidylserine/phosphatidylglycerophosphate/cardiolipin synthase-like enzyme